jgi:ABC-type transport system involved in cytochrome bd biosynthesis fused ATPase/permease subunit
MDIAHCAQRTSLSIAHRLSTIVSSDLIFCLQDGAFRLTSRCSAHTAHSGRIVESGSFSELLTKQGLFAELWQKQIQAEEESEQKAEALQAEAKVLGPDASTSHTTQKAT